MASENITTHPVYKKVMIIFNPHAGEGRHPVHVDAEFLCHTPVEFVVCPKALKVAVAQDNP